MKTKPILIYHGDQQDQAQHAEQTLTDLGFTYRVIEDAQLSQSLGYLMQLEDFEANEQSSEAHFEFNALLLPTMEQEKIMELSKQLREANVNIARKAMLTEHNRNWPLEALLTEINEEHAYFTNRDKLQKLLMKSISIAPDNVPQDYREPFQKAVVETYDILKRQSQPKEIEDAIATLEPLYEAITQ